MRKNRGAMAVETAILLNWDLGQCCPRHGAVRRVQGNHFITRAEAAFDCDTATSLRQTNDWEDTSLQDPTQRLPDEAAQQSEIVLTDENANAAYSNFAR